MKRALLVSPSSVPGGAERALAGLARHLPRNAEIVRANVQRNGLDDNVTVLQGALGASHGTLELHSEPGGVGNAAATSGVDHEEMRRHGPPAARPTASR